jgi:hypothetical protein
MVAQLLHMTPVTLIFLSLLLLFCMVGLQSITTALAVASVDASSIFHVVKMGGGAELPCVDQAIR